jgi:hypothetical protein
MNYVVISKSNHYKTWSSQGAHQSTASPKTQAGKKLLGSYTRLLLFGALGRSDERRNEAIHRS